jgi:hypothetical protein
MYPVGFIVQFGYSHRKKDKINNKALLGSSAPECDDAIGPLF